jgi:hypothetical protein
MRQVSWRAPDELIEAVRAVAQERGLSLNEYLTQLARAATDPSLAGDEASRLRERLARAGLLSPTGKARPRPDTEDVARARREAGGGTPLSTIIGEQRD